MLVFRFFAEDALDRVQVAEPVRLVGLKIAALGPLVPAVDRDNTNSSQLPSGFTSDPFKALDYQDDLQTQYTGGTVLHLYMNERISSSESCKNFIRRVLENYRLPYVSISPVYSICPKHGYLNGEHKFCPLCDQELIERKRKELETV